MPPDHTGPKNPELYEALQREFGTVVIANDREEFQLSTTPEIVYRNGRMTIKQEVVNYGETYRVDCPFCNDTRQRLYIPHSWAEEDEETRRDNLHLATCFNEECLKDHDNREALRDMVWPIGRHDPDATGRTRARPMAQVQVIPPPMIVMPTHLTRIDQLPLDHAAAAYLLGRGFDPAELWSRWRVSYCPGSPDSRPSLVHKIVYPIHGARIEVDVAGRRTLAAELAGWQARAVGQTAGRGAPKYLTAKGMAKSKVLYGLPQAMCTSGPVVVVEGPTDVWRLRTNAVALLGKDASPHQQWMICRWFPRRPVVVLLDRDAGDRAVQLRRALLALRASVRDTAPVAVAALPDGRNDVGECTYEDAWAVVAPALGRPLSALGLGSASSDAE